MATKSVLQSLSNTKLASGVQIPAVDHREVNDAFLLNAYGTPVIESYTNLADNTPNTTPNSTTHYYTLNFVKQGRVVYVNGTMTNKTGSIVSNQKWFDIDSGEYTHDSENVFFVGISTTSGDNVRCRIVGTAVYVYGVIGNNETIEVNFQYNTLN